MKAIILERRGAEIAALCEDGSVVRLRHGGAVGETIQIERGGLLIPSPYRRRLLRGAVAAVLALAITGGGLGYMTFDASAYVSLESEDSSIELTVNHFGRVIGVSALTDEAKPLAESLGHELRHRKVSDALDRAMTEFKSGGYLDADDTFIAGVSSDDARRGGEIRTLLEQSAEQSAGGRWFVSQGSRAEREEALGQHMSPGRFAYERERPFGLDRDDDDDSDAELAERVETGGSAGGPAAGRPGTQEPNFGGAGAMGGAGMRPDDPDDADTDDPDDDFDGDDNDDNDDNAAASPPRTRPGSAGAPSAGENAGMRPERPAGGTTQNAGTGEAPRDRTEPGGAQAPEQGGLSAPPAEETPPPAQDPSAPDDARPDADMPDQPDMQDTPDGDDADADDGAPGGERPENEPGEPPAAEAGPGGTAPTDDAPAPGIAPN